MNSGAYLYIDESGKSSLSDDTSNHFLLTGVIVKQEDLITIEGFFNFIKLKFSLNQTEPFHSYEVYENPETMLPAARSRLLSEQLDDFLSIIPIEICIVSIDKSIFRSTLGVTSTDQFKGSKKRKEMRDFPYRVMSTCLFGQFASYLEKNNLIGQIIADSRRGGDHQLLKSLHLCKEGSVNLKKGYKGFKQLHSEKKDFYQADLR